MKKLYRIVEESSAGMTLEKYLRQVLKFTKAQIKSMKFRPDGLLVNGLRSRVTCILRAGDELTIQLEEEQEASVQLVPTEGVLEILYEDQDLIAVWKESGLVVHPSHGHYQDTLSNRLHGYFQRKGEKVTIRSIGRLDRDTSGIVVFAKNQVAAARLWKQKEEGLFWKEYLAVCDGEMEEAAQTDSEQGIWHTINAPLGKAEGELMKMCVRADGLSAVTHYQVIRKTNSYSWIRVRIDTGRTHQIRVHMASAGHPIVGDVLYNPAEESRIWGKERERNTGNMNGAEAYNLNGEDKLQLCAWRAELLQPFTGEAVEIKRQYTKTYFGGLDI